MLSRKKEVVYFRRESIMYHISAESSFSTDCSRQGLAWPSQLEDSKSTLWKAGEGGFFFSLIPLLCWWPFIGLDESNFLVGGPAEASNPFRHLYARPDARRQPNNHNPSDHIFLAPVFRIRKLVKRYLRCLSTPFPLI